jgi:hypothetical protein
VAQFPPGCAVRANKVARAVIDRGAQGGVGMSDEPKVMRDTGQIHWLVIRPDKERVCGFRSEAAAWRYIDRGDHLRPINKDIKTYVEGDEL